MSIQKSKWHDEVWTERYGHICGKNGMLVHVHGVGERDTYNPAVYENGPLRIMAFRCEKRQSRSAVISSYHPSIWFARPHVRGDWRVDTKIPIFDMMEDPFIFYLEEKGMQKVVFGGVRVREQHGVLVPQTEFYKGDSLDALELISFAVIHNMKDVRLLQLPDGRFLLCRRPKGDKYVRGRITLHVLDSLDQLVDVDKLKLPTLAILDSCQDALDWVGVNEAQMLKDRDGRAWVGLLGHVALEDRRHTLHYAASTYKISLQDLLDGNIHKICPQIIATRACFTDGPSKSDEISDIVFPGHLEHLNGYSYRLWAGLSDTRIGTIELEDPFRLKE